MNRYALYVISIIWVTLVLRVVDLQIISVLLEPIRQEFEVSDTALGLLTGFGFSLFYGLLSIPIAWLADRKNRKFIISGAVGLWSAATASCGFASSFATLFASRMLVGVGEAGGQAPAYSLVGDISPPNRRSTVFAFLSSSVPMGSFLGLLIGALGASLGWRPAFIIMGVFGIVTAMVVMLTVKEPKRTHPIPKNEPYAKAIKKLVSIPSYVHFVLGNCLFTTGAMASGVWITSFFVRVFDLPLSTVAVSLAFIFGGMGITGALLGGWVVDRLVNTTGNKRWYANGAAIVTAVIPPIAAAVFLNSSAAWALGFFCAVVLLMHAWMGPSYGTIQTLAGPFKATATAINALMIGVISYGLGPLLVGNISDYLMPMVGENSLRYAILSVVALTYSWAALHFWLAGRTLVKDLS